MSAPEFTRRPSYGPTSPAVGERGARTRQRIIEVTLALLEERGFHNTLVDDIATGADLSRAALYQYFGSKEEIFVELLRECGAAMLRVIPRLGATGPTAEGYDNLHWWLGEWAWVYDRYATMFVEWSHVDSPNAPMRPLIGDFIDEYARRIARRLEPAGVEGFDLHDLAVAMLGTVNRINYYRSTDGVRGVSDDELLETLATILQLTLFPDTPPEALVHTAPPESAHLRPPSPGRLRPRRPAAVPVAGFDERTDGLSERAAATVARLLDAGSVVFAGHGFHAASVDDIVTEAGLGRGTFYKYFEDKLDLLRVLAKESVISMAGFADDLDRVGLGPGSDVALRAWLRDFLAMHRRYTGVFRVWVEREPDDAALQAMGYEFGRRMARSFEAGLTAVERAYPFNVRAASLVVMAILERIPDEVMSSAIAPSDDRLVELMALMIERGLLNDGRRRRASQALAG